MSPYRLRAYISLVAVAAIWGAAGPVIKFTLNGVDPLPFLTYRISVAAIFALGFFGAKIRRGKKFKRLRANFFIALIYSLFAIPITLGALFLALDRTNVLDLTLIGAAGPLFVVLGSVIFFRDRITRREKLGIIIVFLGVSINSFLPIIRLQPTLKLTGNLLLLIFLLADTGSILLAKKAVRVKIKPVNLTNLAFIIGALVFIPLSIFSYGVDALAKIYLELPLKYHMGVWYMALISGNLAYYLYVKGQRSIETSEAILFNYLQPVFSVPLAIFWLGETASVYFVIGAMIIIFGLIIAQYKKKRIASKI